MYPDTELASPCPILMLLIVRLGSDIQHFYKSLVWLGRDSKLRKFRTGSLRSTDSTIASGYLGNGESQQEDVASFPSIAI